MMEIHDLHSVPYKLKRISTGPKSNRYAIIALYLGSPCMTICALVDGTYQEAKKEMQKLYDAVFESGYVGCMTFAPFKFYLHKVPDMLPRKRKKK